MTDSESQLSNSTTTAAKLRKIVSIKNVGRFLSYSASGDVELKRYNLVFAENGRGKTTLCAILRSVQNGDPAQVSGRSTLGASSGPEITILLDSGTSTFSDGSWSTTIPNLSIFDSTFVSENVYSGDAVDLGHRRNLYRVIIGKQGVDLARKIEGFDRAIRDKSSEIRQKQAAVQAFVPQGVTVDAFLKLEEDKDIDVKIKEKEGELEAVKQADQIKSRQALQELTLPTIPANFRDLLTKTIDGIAKDVENRVSEQIEHHAMHGRGQPWLSEGLGYVRDNACPFCGQSLDQVALVKTYKDYFSDAYKALRTEIADLRQVIENSFSDREIAATERIADQNAAAVDFWSRFCKITAPTLGDESIGATLRSLRQAALSILDQKAAAPLDRLNTDDTYGVAEKLFISLQKAITLYNRAVKTANDVIEAKKVATGTANVRSVESALTILKATKARHEADAKVACREYTEAQAEKKSLEDQKTTTKRDLDRYSEKVMGGYERTINSLLEDFQAGFRITGTRHGYPGGVASSSYRILINETPVDLGDANTPADRPSFRNTLSSGDRSTLALAFFLAQLQHDPEKNTKVVVFDDPFNSQDSFRKDCTVQKIKKCGESSRQVVVLSHDQGFLKRIWDRLSNQADDRKCLQFARVGLRDTTIANWDIEEATQASLNADRKALADYHNAGSGSPREIVQKIRPVLETYCRILFSEFANDALGTIISKVRTAGQSHQLFYLLDDLEGLNEYTRRYMHGENPNAATESINDTELQGFVKKTLTITGGC